MADWKPTTHCDKCTTAPCENCKPKQERTITEEEAYGNDCPRGGGCDG